MYTTCSLYVVQRIFTSYFVLLKQWKMVKPKNTCQMFKCHEPHVSAIECNPVMFEHLQMTETTWALQVSEKIIDAIYLGVSQIQCELPDKSQSYEVSFSNNGITYGSTKIILLNYDPVCVACNFANRTCAPRVCRMVYFLLCLVDYSSGH